MTQEHTPGPWVAREHPEGRAGVSLPTGRMIARCESMFGRPHVASSEWEANARLIAAAPDLLEAIQNLMGLFDNAVYRRRLAEDALYVDAVQHARAVLAKAKAA